MFWDFLKNTQISFKKSVIIILLFSLIIPWIIYQNYPEDVQIQTVTIQRPEKKFTYTQAIGPEEWRYIPGPISIERMKTKGCVADGLLSGYGDDPKEATNMINRSECAYLHRSLETWLAPPDFPKASEIMQRIKKPGIIYSMFIAEALKKNEDYYYPDEKRDFDFSKMCRKGSENFWGEHTCKPDFESGEYRKYLKYITEQAMDLGIQSFLFGQIYHQDESDLSKSELPRILSMMRSYAKKKNMQIAIGAQTNDIQNEKYLRRFDYIEGGVGINADGDIQNGPCHTRWWKKPGDWCWALLWNDQFAKKANNVFLHLDWSGLKYDDMGVFSRMSQENRLNTLKNLHTYFNSKDMGFMMPFLATIHRENEGCYGPKKRFYSPSNKYKCKDEDTINAILRKNN